MPLTVRYRNRRSAAGTVQAGHAGAIATSGARLRSRWLDGGQAKFFRWVDVIANEPPAGRALCGQAMSRRARRLFASASGAIRAAPNPAWLAAPSRRIEAWRRLLGAQPFVSLGLGRGLSRRVRESAPHLQFVFGRYIGSDERRPTGRLLANRLLASHNHARQALGVVQRARPPRPQRHCAKRNPRTYVGPERHPSASFFSWLAPQEPECLFANLVQPVVAGRRPIFRKGIVGIDFEGAVGHAWSRDGDKERHACTRAFT